MNEDFPIQQEEVLAEEAIPVGKETLQDSLLKKNVALMARIRPAEGIAFNRANTIHPDKADGTSGSAIKVRERDLPIVREVEEKLKQARESGRIPTQEHNPFGENIETITLKIFGDIHVRGSDMTQVTSFLNRDHFIHKLGQWEQEHVGRRPLATLFSNFGKLQNKAAEAKATQNFETFLAFKNRMVRSAREDRGDKERGLLPESATLLVNIGDNGFNEHRVGDMAFVVDMVEEMRREMEAASQSSNLPERPVYMTHNPGNHDADIYNFGLEYYGLHKQFFGEQVFSQDIGDDVRLVFLNTNLYSTFWRELLEERKQQLAHFLSELSTARQHGDSLELQQLEQKYQEYGKFQAETLVKIREEIQRQRRVVEAAKTSGKQLILVGHEEGYLLQALGGDVTQTRIIATVSGHDHMHKNRMGKEKNRDGQPIRSLGVGAEAFGVNINKNRLSGFSVLVASENGKATTTVEDLFPENQDFDYAKMVTG